MRVYTSCRGWRTTSGRRHGNGIGMRGRNIEIRRRVRVDDSASRTLVVDYGTFRASRARAATTGRRRHVNICIAAHVLCRRRFFLAVRRTAGAAHFRQRATRARA